MSFSGWRQLQCHGYRTGLSQERQERIAKLKQIPCAASCELVDRRVTTRCLKVAARRAAVFCDLRGFTAILTRAVTRGGDEYPVRILQRSAASSRITKRR